MIDIDFEQVNIKEILEYLNIRNIRDIGEELQFSCPFPEHRRGDQNPSSSINTKDGRWNCFGCGRGGNLVTFVSQYEEVPPAQAAKWIVDGYGGRYGESRSLEKLFETMLEQDEQVERSETIPEETLNLFKVDWEKWYEAYEQGRLPKPLALLFRRGFPPSVLSRYQFGFDQRSNRFTIPIRNLQGKLIGFKGRACRKHDRPKYIGVGDRTEKVHYGFPTVKTSNYVYNIHLASEANGIIVEGELDAIRLREEGFNAVALGGSNVSKEQTKQIIAKFASVILCLDPDEAGAKAERNLSHSLLSYMPVRIVNLPGTDPADTDIPLLHKLIQEAQPVLQIN